MKRLGGFCLAIVLTLGLGVAATQAKPKKVKVETAISIETYSINNPSDHATLGGVLSAAKPKCVGGRIVSLRRAADDLNVDTTTADSAGGWSASFNPQETGFGDYEAVAQKLKIKKRRNGKLRKVIVCKEGVSPPYETVDHP